MALATAPTTAEAVEIVKKWHLPRRLLIPLVVLPPLQHMLTVYNSLYLVTLHMFYDLTEVKSVATKPSGGVFEISCNVYEEIRKANLDQSLHGALGFGFDALGSRPLVVRYLVRHQPEDTEHA